MLVAAGFVPGCTPLATNNAIRDAEAALEQARTDEADSLAPYEFWRAQAYLDKAKRAEGYAEFGYAEVYAIEAKVSADRALENARINAAKKKAAAERQLQQEQLPQAPQAPKAPQAPQAPQVPGTPQPVPSPRAPVGGR